jgi:hypothetical protein
MESTEIDSLQTWSIQRVSRVSGAFIQTMLNSYPDFLKIRINSPA